MVGVPPHPSYRVVASHPDYLPAFVSDVQVDTGQRVEGIELALESGGSVRGTVYDDIGVGLPNARVQVHWHASPEYPRDEWTEIRLDRNRAPWSTLSDNQGRYEIHGLLPGAYTVSAHHDGRIGPELVSFKIDGAEKQDNVHIQFPSGEVLRGRLLDHAGTPLVDWFLHPKIPGEFESRTGDAGEFEFRGLEPGKIRVKIIRTRQHWYWTVHAWFETTLPRSELIIQLPRPAIIKGQTLSATGELVASDVETGTLSVKDAIPLSHRQAHTETPAPFLLEVLPGRYRLQARRRTRDDAGFSIEDEEAKPTAHVDIEVSAGEVLEGIKLVFPEEK